MRLCGYGLESRARPGGGRLIMPAGIVRPSTPPVLSKEAPQNFRDARNRAGIAANRAGFLNHAWEVRVLPGAASLASTIQGW